MQKHNFSVEVALRYGLDEAIVLQCLSLWLKERTNDSDYIQLGGQGWLKLTLKQFQGEMPYFSPFKIKSALEGLQSSKLIAICDVDQQQPVVRRRVMCYSLTERGFELAHGEGGQQ